MVTKKELSNNGYIVRIAVEHYQPKSLVGKIYKIAGNWSSDYVDLRGGWRIKREDARLATPKEIKAHTQGIKNIKNIIIAVDDYSII